MDDGRTGPLSREAASTVFGVRTTFLYSTSQTYLPGTIVTSRTSETSLQLYGRGEGSVDWDGAAGTIEWTNFPALRPDGVFTPNVTGVIRIGSASILYRMAGLSLEPDDSGVRRFVGSVQWWTDAPEYRWLAKRLGVEEGSIDPSDGSLASKVYDVTPV